MKNDSIKIDLDKAISEHLAKEINEEVNKDVRKSFEGMIKKQKRNDIIDDILNNEEE